MSDSVQPQRWQPTRLPRPWDSPGKNTGVGCHFLLQCMKVKRESEVAQSCPTLSDPMGCSPWDFPGKSTGVGCHCLLRLNLRWLFYISFVSHFPNWILSPKAGTNVFFVLYLPQASCKAFINYIYFINIFE